MPFVIAGGHRLEYDAIDGRRAEAPTLILLHEGLGSVAAWREFPAKLADATGLPVFAYSRRGYGGSAPLDAPFGVDYMHREAAVLAELRDVFGFEDVILVGHSDGASIALIHAGTGEQPVRALVLEAPHVFVEDMTVASIAAAKTAFAEGGLRQRLARYHGDVDGAFRGWNDIWLHPQFRAWSIEDLLPDIRCPVLAIQGADDEYGSPAQLDAIERGLATPFERLVLQGCKHSPHRDQEAAVLEAMAAFIAGV